MEHVLEIQDDMIKAAARIKENLKLDKSEKKAKTSTVPLAASPGQPSEQQQRKRDCQSTPNSTCGLAGGTSSSWRGTAGTAATPLNSNPTQPPLILPPSFDKSKV